MMAGLASRLADALVRHAPAAAAEPKLRAALEQLVAQPGKLLRAQLVYAGATQHGLPGAGAERLACAVEYYHTASLALDDLPCMDDARVRRGQACVHRTYGEATAILAALALINRAYALVAQAFARQPRQVRDEAQSWLERSLGVAGLVGGQALDLAFADSERSAQRVAQVAAAKTGALFQLAILLPATLARPTAAEWRALRALGVYWGQLYQVADDLRDVRTTTFEAGKSTQRDGALARPNLVLALGEEAARARMARLGRQASAALAGLAVETNPRWGYLVEAAEALAPAFSMREEAQSAAA